MNCTERHDEPPRHATPRRWTHAPVLALTACLATGVFGCASMVATHEALDAVSNVEDRWEEEAESGAKVAKRPEDIQVNLDVPPLVGCLMGAPPVSSKYSEVGAMYCEATALEAGADVDAAEDEIDERIDSGAGYWGMVITDFGEVVRQVLEKRLADRFRTAKVTIGGGGAGSVPVKVTLRIVNGGDYHRFVLMAATPTDGAPISVEGHGEDSVSLGHLGWMIPTVIATGILIGLFAIVSPASTAMHESAAEAALVYAIDDAAQQLADGLARRAVTEPQVDVVASLARPLP